MLQKAQMNRGIANPGGVSVAFKVYRYQRPITHGNAVVLLGSSTTGGTNADRNLTVLNNHFIDSIAKQEWCQEVEDIDVTGCYTIVADANVPEQVVIDTILHCAAEVGGYSNHRQGA